MGRGSIIIFFAIIIISIGLLSSLNTIHTMSPGIWNQTTPVSFQNHPRIPVGVLVMQSGFISDIGTEYTRTFEMVRDEYPDSKVLPVIMDAGSNTSVASSGWRKMITDIPDLPVVVTIASWTTNVVYPDAAQSGIVQVSLGSAVVNRSSSNDRLFRFTPGVEQESPVLAAYLNQYGRIAVLGGDNDYTRGYVSSFETLLNGRIVLEMYYNPDDLESTLNVTLVKQSNPDIIVLLSVSEGGKVIESIRKEGIRVPLVGTRVIERNSLLRNPSSEGLIFTTPALNRSHPFFSRYFNRYKENATFYGAEGFDAMRTLYSAVADCGNSSDCISAWYQNRSFNGALGTIRFDNRGVAFYPMEMKIIKNGKIEDYLA